MLDLGCSAAGKLDFDALRYTCSTLLNAIGTNGKAIQSAMRHATLDMTMNIYTHAEIEQIRAAIDTLPEFRTQPAAMTETDNQSTDAIGAKPLDFTLAQSTFDGNTGHYLAQAANRNDYPASQKDSLKNSFNNSKTKILTQNSSSVIVPSSQASVAQLDRASVFGTEEPCPQAPENNQLTELEIESARQSALLESEKVCPPDLEEFIKVWDRLPDHVRQTIRVIINSAIEAK